MNNTMMPNQMPPWAMGQMPPQPPQLQPAAPLMFSQGQGMGPQQPPPMISQGMGPMPPRAPSGPGLNQGDQLSPELVKNVLAARGLDAQQTDLLRQRKMADMLRASAADQTKGVTVGRMHAAPGAFQLVGSLANSYAGTQMDKDIDASRNTLNQQQADLSRDWFNELAARRQR